MKTRIYSLLAGLLIGGLAACTDETSDNPADGTEVTTDEVETITDDQMKVMVTVELPTAVLRSFDEGTTGAALVKRLPEVTDEIGPDTRMVLVPGTLFDSESSMSAGELNALAQLGLDGGYLAIERPTAQQLFNFATLYAAKLIEMQQLEYQQLFDLDATAAARAAQRSQVVQRTQQRLANIRQVAQRRASDADLNSVRAEMMIFGPTDYFMQQPFETEATVLAAETDGEGNTTDVATKTIKQERTAAVSGSLADAAAAWLNDVAKSAQSNAPRRVMTRAEGNGEELLEASETFTFNGLLYFSDWKNTTQSRSDRLSIKVSAQSVHDRASHTDHYTLQQHVLLSLGAKDGCPQVYYPKGEKSWTRASGDGAYNCWFGAFLTQYQTSMNLTGNGTITLASSTPAADAQPVEGLQMTSNTDGNRVTWTYDGTLPQLYINKVYCHELPAAVQVGNADLNHEVSWSVSNPSGSYTLEVTSAPKLTALMIHSNGSQTPPHKYVDRSDNQTYTHELIKPLRAIQKWRMSVSNVEYDENMAQHGTVEDLENALRADFPDSFVPEFQLGDDTETSLSSITSVINDSKRTFGLQSKHLDELAQRFGMKKFEIIWSREGSVEVKTSQAFVYYVCPKATEATVAHLGWVYGSNGYLYPSADYAKGWYAKPMGILAYLNDGSDFGDKATEKASGAGHGLVLALWDPSQDYLLIQDDAVYPNPIGGSMDKGKNDFDGLAKTKWLAANGSKAASKLSRIGATPAGCTDWFIPSTGQWIAMLCTPGLGGAEIPSDQNLFTPFNINGAAKVSRAMRANGGMMLMEKLWTSSAYNTTNIIWLVNDNDILYFQGFSAWRTVTYVRPAFAF